MSKASIHSLPRRQGGCPICGKAPAAATMPFCSARCRDVDLSRWFGERYAIPAVEPDEVEQDDQTEDDA
ncbi:MAG: DNA gyrase inhibitor YacG [Alphaproteobacteria bacterium]